MLCCSENCQLSLEKHQLPDCPGPVFQGGRTGWLMTEITCWKATLQKKLTVPLVPRETLGRISVFNGLKWRPSGFLPVSRQITSPYCPSLASCIGQGEQRCLPLDCVRVKCHVHLLGSVSIREGRARHHPHTGESKGPSTFLGCRVHAPSRKHSSKITHYLLSGKSKTRQTRSPRGGQSLGTSSTCGEGRDRVGGGGVSGSRWSSG